VVRRTEQVAAIKNHPCARAVRVSFVATPDAYAWLSASRVGTAGCVTVVAQGVPERVAEAFGADPEKVSAGSEGTGAQWPGDASGDWAVFTSSTDDRSGVASVLVIEDNRYQGSRPEVLRVASQASATGKAASIYWNVEGMVVFSCAQKGKLVGAAELLGLTDEELASIPRSLHRLARLCDDPTVDTVAVGAAMVEKFTGVDFGEQALNAGTVLELTPPPADLTDWKPNYPTPAFMSDHRDLLDPITSLTGDRQRGLAEWAALVAVDEAGLGNHEAIHAVVDQYGRDERPRSGSSLDRFRAVLFKRADQIWYQEMETETGGGLEGTFVHQQLWATSAVRQATHPDPLAAAVTTVGDLLGTAACTRTERPGTFVVDETGRHEVDGPDPSAARVNAFAEVLREAIAATPERWPELRRRFPAPLTPDERRDAIQHDAERLERGDFDTWQIIRSDID